jgi:enoyl-CoA hydratase
VELSVCDGIAQVRLNRPDRANALDRTLWSEVRAAFQAVDADPAARVAVLSGNGAHFCAGIDLGMLASLRDAGGRGASVGRRGEALRRVILDLQDCLTWTERCRVPVLAAVHGVCVGAGLDLAVACDLRYATADARFVLKEVEMGVAADVGVLQRLPRIVGEGVTRELAYTGRPISGAEAAELRLVNRVFDTADELRKGVLEIAGEIAAKSPLAMRGTKQAITYGRDHSVADGLEQIATWNAATLLSADLDEAIAAFHEKRPARFED